MRAPRPLQAGSRCADYSPGFLTGARTAPSGQEGEEPGQDVHPAEGPEGPCGRLALAEGLVLGTKAGMQTDNLLKVLQDGACSSKTMIDKGPKMLQGDFTPEGHVKTSLKDGRLALEQGARLGAPMLITSLWTQLQQTAYNQGLADVDSSAFIEVLRGMAGLGQREIKS